MSFLTPFFLLLGLLAAPIILMYMLRLRRREVLVSSTMLWQKLLRDREANAPWQRLRRNWLLILQLLILAALVLALARPFLPVPSVVSGSVVVLLDASASMQATDVAADGSPSRFTVAKAEVERLIGDLGGDSQMTLIKVGQTPIVLAAATGDRRQLREALAAAQPDPAPADWQAAAALAAGAAQGFRDGRIIVVSDGGLPDDLPPLPAETVFVPVGESGENLAITALAARDTDTGPQLFASVRNEGVIGREALLSINLGDTLFDSRRLTIPAGGTANETWDLPVDTAVIQARLTENQEDFLPLDDTAWAVHEGGVANRALLVTAGNLFLEQVYGVLPGVEAFKAAPDSDLATTPDPDEPFALYVFDGAALPDPIPPADLFVINPQGNNELFTTTGAFSDTVAIRLDESPLLEFVDWRRVNIREAKAVNAPWAETLVEAEGGPLLLIGERSGHRIAILTFDVRDSDLPLQIAFPILIANITDWLSPGRAFDAPATLQPGDPVTIAPGAATTAVIVTKPDGSAWTAEAGEEALVFTETEQLGLYRVSLQGENGRRPAGSFAVNLFSPAESAIRPAETLPLGQATDAETAETSDVGQREFWPWLVAIALLILIVEWWIHHRGLRLPQINWQRLRRDA